MRSTLAAVCLALLVVPACHKPDPNSVEDQVKVVAKGKTTKEKLAAIDNLRKIGKREAAPGLAAALKGASGKVREHIAVALGELKDPSVIPAMVDAMDMAVGVGTDRLTQEANAANKESARSLGEMGDKQAVKPLVQLLKVTKDSYVKIEAINALGKLKDPTAVPALREIAEDERLETFINKKAIMALTAINHPDALPTYLKMMFAERKGVSFYPESSFGLFMLGTAAQDQVLKVLAGEDKELMGWAKGRDTIEAAIWAKASQVESDLQDRRAIPFLLKFLKYEDENMQYKLLVRMNAADSLGRMRAKEAAAPIAAMLAEEEANARSAYVRALTQIGDASALPQLTLCAKAGPWSAREFCMWGLALLGSSKDSKIFESFLKEEPARFDKECADGYYGNVECAKEKAAQIDLRTKAISTYKKAIDTAGACEDPGCFQKYLDDKEPVVREHAAYELGRRGLATALPALMAAIKREVKDVVDLNPRFAAICAVDWITQANADAMKKAKADVPALEAQVEQESKKTITMKIAEEVKRLAVKLDRGTKG